MSTTERTVFTLPLAGGAPLCNWELVPTRKNNRAYTPIIAEFFAAPLTISPWEGLKNNRTRITRSTSTSAAGHFDIGVSAAIIRPGKDYNPQMLYKVTLYSLEHYKGNLLVLGFGVYPDLDVPFSFCDRTHSVLFEEGVLAQFDDEDDYAAAEPYYANPAEFSG